MAKAGVKLTPRQREMFDWIVAFIREHGRPPTVRQIGSGMGITSPNGVVSVLRKLNEAGWIAGGGRKEGTVGGHTMGLRIRIGDPCPTCRGLGRILPDEI